MVKHSTDHFVGYDCVKLENDALALWITQSVGPRVIGLAQQGGDNMFAALPGVTFARPDGEAYFPRGGHRLWHAPEDPLRTYIPDDSPVIIDPVENGLHVIQPVEVETGIQKSLSITLSRRNAHVIVDHTLNNQGQWPE